MRFVAGRFRSAQINVQIRMQIRKGKVMKTRTVRVNLQIELDGIHYRLVIDRKATSQLQKHCDKCDLQGTGLCYWDDERGINSEKSITANPVLSGWYGIWKDGSDIGKR